MGAKGKNTTHSWNDPDEAPEWPAEAWDRAEISIGGKGVRPASGTLTKRGRPPVGVEPKRQVSLRLPPAVIEHFKAGGPGWQTRIGEVLERHVSYRGDTADRSIVTDERSDYAPAARKKGKRADRS